MLLSVQRGCQAQECPTAPSPACLAARVHTRVQKKPPLIPLASALPCIHQTRKFPSSSHSKTWGAHIPTGHGSFPAQPQGENTVPKVGMVDGGEESHGHRGGREPASKQDENPSLTALPFPLKVASAAPLSLEAKHSPEEKDKATTCPTPAPTPPRPAQAVTCDLWC